jgi:hypothetical protein
MQRSRIQVGDFYTYIVWIRFLEYYGLKRGIPILWKLLSAVKSEIYFKRGEETKFEKL